MHHSTFLTTSSKCGKINMTKRTLKIIILNGCFQKKIASVRNFATKKKQCFQQKTEERQNPLLQFLERNLNVRVIILAPHITPCCESLKLTYSGI